MTRPFLLVQLSDPHIGATWAGGDPVDRLRAAAESVRRLPDVLDAALMSGDLRTTLPTGSLVRELLAQLGVPVRLSFNSAEIETAAEPPGFAVHAPAGRRACLARPTGDLIGRPGACVGEHLLHERRLSAAAADENEEQSSRRCDRCGTRARDGLPSESGRLGR
jgi:hypothetical protein